MKQTSIIILVILLAFSYSTLVIAGGGKHGNRDHNSYGGHGGHGGGKHNRGRHNRGRHNRGRHNNHYRGRGYYPGAVLGSLIVGGVIGASLSRPYYGNTVYVNPNPVKAISNNKFLLQSNGDCFLITNGLSGNQILSAVPPTNCQ